MCFQTSQWLAISIWIESLAAVWWFIGCWSVSNCLQTFASCWRRRQQEDVCVPRMAERISESSFLHCWKIRCPVRRTTRRVLCNQHGSHRSGLAWFGPKLWLLFASYAVNTLSVDVDGMSTTINKRMWCRCVLSIICQVYNDQIFTWFCSTIRHVDAKNHLDLISRLAYA